MKNLLSIIVMTLMGMSLMAKPVDPTMAVRVAQNFAATQVKMADNTAKIVYTHPMPESGQPAMYVVNVGSSAFVIVAADDIAHPVLGYSMARPWPVLNGEPRSENGEPNATEVSERASLENGERAAAIQLPSQVSGFLDDLASQIQAAQQQDIAQDRETAAEWQRLQASESNPQNSQLDLPDSVGPLLTTTWNQGQYYNALCPEDANGPDGHALTGCVATAMAQIINYWGYPVHGRGSHSYQHNTYGTLSVNYDSATYDYAHMPDALTSTSTPQEINAVAKLLYDCGVANIMFYGAESSGALVDNTRAAFINHFGFSSKLGLADRHMYSENEWKTMLREEVDLGNPVFYAGTNGFSSHAFVLDGYKNDGLFHFNFGWSGYADGWYQTTAINPSMEFNFWQQAIVGIRPDSTEQVALSNFIPLYDISLTLYSTPEESYTVSSPIHLYNMSAKNDYQMDYSSDNGVKPRIFHFSPSDSNGQIVLDVFNIDISHAVVVYDGANMDSLISVLEPAGVGYPYAQLPDDPAMQQCVTNNFSPIVSTKNGLTVVTFSAGMIENELHLLVSDASDCRMVSNITKTRDSVGYKLNWTSHGSASQWQVAWADTLVSCDTTLLVINRHFEDDNLEVKIRSVCGDGNYGEWNSIVLNQKRYWPDYVEEEPEGFFMSGDTVKISSAEALAWWVKQCNTEDWPTGNEYKTIEFLADIDLDAHLWKAIRYYGKVLGNGHTISNLRTHFSYSGNYNGNGLFNYYYGDTISDLHLRDAVVCGDGSIGSLVGSANYAVILNCSSVGYRVRDRFSNVGGLIGGASYSKIINCYAIGGNYGQLTNGGIIGDNYYSELINCYSSQGQESSFQWQSNNSDLYGPGLISGGNEGGVYDNCYADIKNTERQWNPSVDSMAKLYYFFGFYERDHGVLIESANNVAAFRVDGDTIGRIIQDTSVNYHLGDNMDLLTALNHKVVETNSSGLRMWTWDTLLHFPVLGGFYEPTCPNVSNIIASNIEYNDGTAVALSWIENGEAEQWQVKYYEEESSENDAVVYIVFTPNDTVENLTLGQSYYFCVRPICGEDDTVGYSEPVKLFVDKKYWTEVVTQCPAGYVVDNDGNVTISSAEGLAYLDYLNQWQSFEGKVVSIVNDIDMGAYRWKPLSGFIGTIEGNNHIVSNIICRESTSDENAVDIGFTGDWCRCTIRNITIKDGIFSGMAGVGGLFGSGYGGFFENCSIVNALVRGRYWVGGLGGVIPSMSNVETIIKDCSTSGIIYADKSTGGLIGSIQSDDAVIKNCYSSCNISSFGKMTIESRGGLVGGSRGVISNCYSTGIVEYDSSVYYNYTGLSIGDISINCEVHNVYAKYADGIPFEGRDNALLVYPFVLSDTATFDNNGVLNSSVTIASNTYTDLLSALNAWVDANDTAGIYRRWAADSANVNGGFPVFAALPCTPTSGSDTVYVCENYTWHGNVYTASTELLDTLVNFDGCDSIVTHYLIVNQPIHTASSETACDGYIWNGTTYGASGDYTYSHTDANGCMQVDTLHLTINNSTTGDTSAIACESFTWQGTTYSVSGDVHGGTPLQNAAGCDSVVTLHLTINNPVHTATTEAACETYTWNGTAYTVSGDYTYSHLDNNGCTQVDTLHLTINNPVHTVTTEAACETYTWNGTAYTVSGDYTYVHADNNGCTQVDTLHLTINNPVHTATTEAACETYTWNGTAYTVSGDYTYSHLDNNGCTQVDTLHLTINNPVHTATTEAVCETYTWNGTAYTVSGDYTYSHLDNNGCTQVDTLHLTINNPVHTVTTEAACETYTWNGTAYTVSGDYTYVHADNNGCTQVDTLHLTVNHITTGDTTAVACDSFTWWNTNYTNSTNEATHTLTNAAGCDSTVTLHLTINHSTTGVDVQTACDSYTWIDGNTYTESNFNSQFSILNSLGCDSTVTLNLTVNHSVTVYDTLTIGSNELPYDYYGNSIEGQGNFTFEGTTSEGCDSTMHLFVIVNQVGIDDVQTADGITLFPNPTSGTVTVSGNGLERVEVMDVVGRSMLVVECQRDSEMVDLSELPQGAYVVRIATKNGTAVKRVVKK